jgi:hypothetical protein
VVYLGKLVPKHRCTVTLMIGIDKIGRIVAGKFSTTY